MEKLVEFVYGAIVLGAIAIGIASIVQYGELPDPGEPDLFSGWVETAVAEEIVDVKYRGAIDVSPFACTDITRSSFIERVCFDKRRNEMLINLKGAYYAYCGIPADVVDGLMAADSMGRFYNAQVKGRYGCR